MVFRIFREIRQFFGVGALILLVVGFVWGLLIAPPDYQQGSSFESSTCTSRRRFYLRVYIWRWARVGLSCMYGAKLADVLISACLPLGMSLTVLALFSGAVWGKPTWGTWWEWDGRIVSTTVLLFSYRYLCAKRSHI